ncbi:sll1863 family stress response protein [Marinobacter fonticola]|uniref:hypothetical protein n=1 Tax=Marinobacter fonticola TaxID=2603215 RepID=UPI0011E7B447|nr:hypothetical protein [Marinobacter fonticola]
MRAFHVPVLGRLALVLAGIVGFTAVQADDNDVSVEALKQDTQALAQKLESYTADQREDAIQAINQTLDALDKRIDSLEEGLAENWDEMSDEAREETQRSLDALKDQRAKVAEWYARLKDSSVSAWSAIKGEFADAYDRLSEAWRNAEDEVDEETEKLRESI